MKARLFGIIAPIAGLIAVLAVILIGRPLDPLTGSAPPVEELSVESVRLVPGLISISVRADGSAPLRLAQVQVDGAYRAFTADPASEIDRLGRARVDIPYPWVEGDSHHVVLVTGTGATFEHTLDVAVPTGAVSDNGWLLALVGLLLGPVPVGLGLLAFPALRSASGRWQGFVLSVTLGLLLFLFIDTLREGLEVAESAIGRLRAGPMVWVSMISTAAILLAVGRHAGRPPAGLALSGFIALGIGLHNLGEGLVVGAALSTGAASLAAFLVVGFVLHNVSEGLAIASPAVEAKPSSLQFLLLAALAGLPAIAGVFLGASVVSPFWTALCFGVGAGAIAQVVIEVTGLLAGRAGKGELVSAHNLGGVVAGLAVMYATALLI